MRLRLWLELYYTVKYANILEASMKLIQCLKVPII
jgi:hypothetical protein